MMYFQGVFVFQEAEKRARKRFLKNIFKAL